MSVRRRVLPSGAVRYRARVKSSGVEVANKTFERRADAVAWEQDQLRRLSRGNWIDPRRGKVSFAFVAEGWLDSLNGLKRRSRETDESNWRVHIEPHFGRRLISSVTTAEVSEWAGRLVGTGRSPSTVRRILATLRSLLAHAVADERLVRNVAMGATIPKGRARREGQYLTWDELSALTTACRGPDTDVVMFLGNTGLRWGELAGLQVGDIIQVPAPGLRLQRAVLSAGGSGELFIDTLKNHKARTVPLTPAAAEIALRRTDGRAPHEWLFATPTGTAMRGGNWKRSSGWITAKKAIGRPAFQVRDLRHTAASLWIAAGADVKVLQRILGHASATMTMDLYGHLMDESLWNTAQRVRGHFGGTSDNRKDG